MEEKDIYVKAPKLGPKYKQWRMENNFSLEQASQISGLEIKTIQKFERGGYVTAEEMLAYHQFFLKHIPNVFERYGLSEKTIFTQLVFDFGDKIVRGNDVEEETSIYTIEN